MLKSWGRTSIHRDSSISAQMYLEAFYANNNFIIYFISIRLNVYNGVASLDLQTSLQKIFYPEINF